jgi:hypothetical protein
MRYMMLIYTSERHLAVMPEDEAEQVRQGHRQVIGESQKKGKLVACNPLARTNAATTVRIDNGTTLVAETKEQLAGYYVLDCKDLQEAIAWAAKIPTSCGGHRGCIEIRELKEIPGVPESVLPTPALANAASS